ncbi:MAG: hypothetical protein AAF530_01140 [Pseudomonadota bacterium]
MTQNIHISISYLDGIPLDFVDEFVSNVTEKNLVLQNECRPSSVYATIEWMLPSVIAIFISKYYFESFLKEAGKDHYYLLKDSISALFKKLFGSESELRPQKCSLLISIHSQSKEGRHLKFVFPEGVSQDEYGKMLESLFDLLIQHYESEHEEELTRLIDRVSISGGTIYIEYSTGKKKWTLIDPASEAKKKATKDGKR